MGEQPELERNLSWTLLVLYGLGTTVGAGIYALTGEVAATAGMASPWAYLLASLLAGVSALSFAELSARFPRSAGEALYVQRGLGLRWLSTMVGLMVALAGVVSSAAVANAFVGYLGEFVALPRELAIAVFVGCIGGISAWGIGTSVRLAAVITLLEVGGVAAIIIAAGDGLAELPARWPELQPPSSLVAWNGILAGTLLAFYAFIGFEDMVNVAEEVRDVRRTLPLAIVTTLVLTTLLYVVLATVAVLTVPPEELGRASNAPLSLLWERSTGRDPALISGIAAVAMLNGALIQIVMASRVLYGLARQNSLPRALGRVHAYTKTPLLATSIATLTTLALALFLPLAPLAAATSVITLVIFALVNLSLWRLMGAEGDRNVALSLPRWLPALGFLISAGFVALALLDRVRA